MEPMLFLVTLGLPRCPRAIQAVYRRETTQPCVSDTSNFFQKKSTVKRGNLVFYYFEIMIMVSPKTFRF